VDRFVIPLQIGSIANNRAALLELHNEVIEMGKLPDRECKARFQELKSRINELPPLARLLFPATMKVTEAFVRSQAQMRTTITALAAERYRKVNGRWPDSPSALVPGYLKGVLTDPYGDAPVRFRRLADGLIIYSIGPDEQDNGGNLGNGMTPGTDIGVRLWDVARRRQPPLSVKPDDVQ
jgi:hypothetical protein